MLERKGLVSFKETPVTIVGDELKVGDKAPNFKAVKADLSEFSLEELGDKIKVISVVPSLDTRVCSIQTVKFNKEAEKFKDEVVVVSISVDLPFAQKRFCEASQIENLVTVSDHRDLDFGYQYGLVMKELRLLARAVMVLDRDNTIKHFSVNEQVSSEPNYDEVLEVVKELI